MIGNLVLILKTRRDATMEFSPELAVLRLFTRDKNYLDKYSEVCNNILKEEHIYIIYNTIKQYYSNINKEHNYISKDELISYINISYNSYKGLNIVIDIVNNIYDLDISDSLSKNIINNLVEKHLSNDIINKLLPVITENKFDILSSVQDILEDYKNLVVKSDEGNSPFFSASLKDIIEELVVQDGGLKWRLQCLQDSLGSLQGGILGHVFARPNSGKTSFLSSEITNFARQLGEGESIIWFNNEERGKKVQLRLYNTMLGASDDMISRNIERAEQEFDSRNGNAIKICDSGIIQFSDIVSCIKDYNPRLIVIDQADKIHFKGMGTMDLPVKLKELYKHYREVAKEFDIPIITVGQASSEAEGRKWLRPDWMDYSKTGKYAETDFIVGIGKSHDEGEKNLRFINICKNKMRGIETPHTTLFEHVSGRYKDL